MQQRVTGIDLFSVELLVLLDCLQSIQLRTNGIRQCQVKDRTALAVRSTAVNRCTHGAKNLVSILFSILNPVLREVVLPVGGSGCWTRWLGSSFQFQSHMLAFFADM